MDESKKNHDTLPDARRHLSGNIVFAPQRDPYRQHSCADYSCTKRQSDSFARATPPLLECTHTSFQKRLISSSCERASFGFYVCFEAPAFTAHDLDHLIMLAECGTDLIDPLLRCVWRKVDIPAIHGINQLILRHESVGFLHQVHEGLERFAGEFDFVLTAQE